MVIASPHREGTTVFRDFAAQSVFEVTYGFLVDLGDSTNRQHFLGESQRFAVVAHRKRRLVFLCLQIDEVPVDGRCECQGSGSGCHTWVNIMHFMLTNQLT